MTWVIHYYPSDNPTDKYTWEKESFDHYTTEMKDAFCKRQSKKWSEDEGVDYTVTYEWVYPPYEEYNPKVLDERIMALVIKKEEYEKACKLQKDQEDRVYGPSVRWALFTIYKGREKCRWPVRVI